MLLPLLFLVAPSLSLPHSQREANYRALPDDVGGTREGGKMKLVFANAVWRHGDRSPEQPLPGDGTDKFGENDWQFGGGGYGELSPTGMNQQYIVGGKIGERYMNQFDLLTKRYRAQEIYVRSTDYNRTLISAYSNLAGMYAGTGKPDADLPATGGWPTGWVPIPVHTVVNKHDYAGNPDADCKRKAQVKQLILSSDEFIKYKNDTQVKATLDYLTDKAQGTVSVENSYWFQDTMNCEDIHSEDLAGPNSDAKAWYPWYWNAGAVPDILNNIVGRALDFTDGLGNPDGVRGIDVSLELPRMRAGETIGTIYDMIQGALYCYRENDKDTDSCRKFFKKRRYFALSAHDKTVAALLTLLGPKKYVIPLGYPDFAAATLIELYVNEETSEEYFKVLYLSGPDDNFKSVTNYVRGCPIYDEFCPLSVLKDIVDVYVPKPDMETYCNTDLFPEQ